MIVRLLGALLIVVLSAAASHAFVLESGEGRFTVEMPAKPEFKLRRIQRERDGAIFESNEWRLDQPWVTWLVSYRDYAPTAADATAEKMFERVLQELPVILDGELRYHKFFERKGARALEIRIYVPRNRMLLRSHIIVSGLRRYVVSYVGPDGTETNATVETFLKSFHVLP